MCKSIGSLFFSPKGGGAYDLGPVILEMKLTTNYNLKNGGNHNGKIIITQDAERAAVKAAEAEFMEREMKVLQKHYEAEKVKIRAQMVAEPGARW